ncbi:30S ribosomal protein S5 [Candidatus Woesearchaeota archaeon]|nr:30S ribosomal protein S5 [Candidatus Woesearchaeota archaeon]
MSDQQEIKSIEVYDAVKIEEVKKPDIIVSWVPKTRLGRDVKEGRISSMDQIIDSGQKILEAEIVDSLMGSLAAELMMIGQAKGKFGGGQRRVFKQTQKKTAEGNKPSFSTCVVVGNRDGYVGVGYGKSRETVPAREKAIRNAKLNLIKIRRGCGSWECGCREPHSIPFKVSGSCGSVKLELLPAPKGTGLVVQKECQKILALAGIRDVWSKTEGQTRTTVNLIKACEAALERLMSTKMPSKYSERLGVREGSAR